MKNMAINGLGRIGKLVVRRLFDVGLGTNLTQLNDLNSDSEMLAHLLEFDTVHGKWQKSVSWEEGEIVIDDVHLKLTNQNNKAKVNSGKIDLLIDCTGSIKNCQDANTYFESGIPQVLVSAPVNDEKARNIVFGVNHEIYNGPENLVSLQLVAPQIVLLPL